MDEFAHAVSFVLDDRVVTIDFSKSGAFKPSTTVLNYLRSLDGHKGVKEGCAEGDCGACTVVVAALDGRGGLEYHSLDSCLLFLPMIHGKQLITVENLAQKNNGNLNLHPVQKAMVATGGSQCGYCTPGIVMSLFALYKTPKNIDNEIITEALTGNLCRCTGYRPIIEAAEKACSGDRKDQFSENEDSVIAMLRMIEENSTTLELSSDNQIYLKPFGLEEALKLRKLHPDALVVNGSTDAALLQTKKKIHIPKILDISAVNELKILVEDENFLAIGSGVVLQEVYEFTVRSFPPLAEILKWFGSLQIRNLATLGGNIGSASPIGDTLPVLIAAESKIRLIGSEGSREMLLEDFITGYRKTAIRPDELITLVIIPKPGGDEILRIYKISKRRDLDISSVSACFRLKLDETGRIEKARLVFGGMAEMTKRARLTEEFLLGKTWSREIADKAGDMICREFSPISDARADADSRRIMAKNLLLKFWTETLNPIKS